MPFGNQVQSALFITADVKMISQFILLSYLFFFVFFSLLCLPIAPFYEA